MVAIENQKYSQINKIRSGTPMRTQMPKKKSILVRSLSAQRNARGA